VTDETLDTSRHRSSSQKKAAALHPGFVVVWAAENPALVGAWLPPSRRGESLILGRAGQKGEDDPKTRLLPVYQRPEENEPGPPIADPFLSREQLRVTAKDGGIHVANVGKRDLLDGRDKIVTEALVRPGDVLEVRGRLLLYVAARPAELPKLQNIAKKHHTFGEADPFGLVGESELAWRLRDSAAFVASRTAHVLLLGDSGTGKEVVARTIHERSGKGNKRLVSRNAATLPAGLIDAELFGHVANYPNAGMPERPGLIGDADGSTLFLDEIGELSHDLSTKLLRVLDEGGEYQRLGDTRTRQSKFRLVAATNRPLSSLKSDVAARFKLRISVPPLGDRKEDIPLLARHLLRRAAVQDPGIGSRFFDGWDGRNGEPRLSIELMKQLIAHDYTTHIRELDVLLWASLGSSTTEIAELTPEVEESLQQGEPSMRSQVDVRNLTADDVKAALERAGGVHDKAWRELGLANRHVLKRLVKKFGLRE
jgi:two-component system nitrogen regulation response regulator GlnG/two-component system response regulator HydG